MKKTEMKKHIHQAMERELEKRHSAGELHYNALMEMLDYSAKLRIRGMIEPAEYILRRNWIESKLF